MLALTGILLGVWKGVGGLGALGALKEANEAADADCRGLRELASDIRLPGRPAARLAGRRGAALEVVGIEKLLAELMRRSVTGVCWVRWRGDGRAEEGILRGVLVSASGSWIMTQFLPSSPPFSVCLRLLGAGPVGVDAPLSYEES